MEAARKISHELPSRWTPLRPHPIQRAYRNSKHRFNTVPAGRRSGKTEIGKRKLVRKCLGATTKWAPRYFAGAPTRDQAKRIFWQDLKDLVGLDMMRRKPSESELIIYTINGGEIHVVGLDKPERVEGSPWDGCLITEMGNIKATVWPMHVRPALSDRMGWADLEGVPEGRNHYYELDLTSRALMKELGDASEWGSFTWKSADILPASEIEAAKRDLDQLTFEQEYEASFVNFSGRAYYPFLETTHCAPLAYNPKAILALCFDFNVDPGVCAVVQEQRLPKQFVHDPKTGVPLLDNPIIGTGVIGEVHIPRNSNTPAVCRKIISDWGKHLGRVVCYGDATGGARGSAKVQGSDWELITKELKPVFGERLSFRVKSANPAERARINAVNSRLKSTTGDIRLMVDGRKAPHVVKDFEGVTLLEGGSGEIDKDETPALTHLSDAVGYYCEYEYPVSGPGLYKLIVAGH
jgi:hypothetical protein